MIVASTPAMRKKVAKTFEQISQGFKKTNGANSTHSGHPEVRKEVARDGFRTPTKFNF
jgi:hypothetical protein